MIKVRGLQERDWPVVWQFMEPVIHAGERYPHVMDMTVNQARHMWLEVTEAAYVAGDDTGALLGYINAIIMYKTLVDED